MRNKKAFEIQFNWIFVLVAGAAIILFFTVIVVKQKNVSEFSNKATMLKGIQSIITGASVSTDTTKIIDLPNANIEINCNKVGIDGVSNQYQKLILFAPGLIKGDRIITQTLAFSAPYRAANLLYMTNDRVRYVIIGDNEIAKEVNKSLPSDLRKNFYKSVPSAIKNENNYKVRFIISENIDETKIDIKKFEKIPDSDVTAVKVSGDLSKGEVEFYQKDKDKFSKIAESRYITKSSLIGAVYSDTLETYECNMQNAFSRLNLVTKVYIERTNKLMSEVLQAQCTQFYSNALNNLDIILSSSSNFEASNIDAIANAANSLASENKNAQINSCASVY